MMEQYWMPKGLDFENLRFCTDNYKPAFLYIRLVGSVAASRGIDSFKIGADLGNNRFDFRKTGSGLYMLIDSEAVFHFPLNDYDKGFSLAYERIIPSDDGICKKVMLSHGNDPYDPNLPEPNKSTLRTVLDNHLMEIDFKGRIHLKFHSWWIMPHWKYYTIDTSRDKK